MNELGQAQNDVGQAGESLAQGESELGRILNPSVKLAYLSACAYLGRKPDGRGRRRVIAEAQGKLRRMQMHARAVAQGNAAATLRRAVMLANRAVCTTSPG